MLLRCANHMNAEHVSSFTQGLCLSRDQLAYGNFLKITRDDVKYVWI